MAYYGWRPYVPVAKRRANTAREMNKLRKKGMNIEPVEIAGRKIARTFWGQGWCEHLEQFSDYANRLPRGRTYVRNGSVCHLEIKQGQVDAIVSGSALYRVGIEIKPLSKPKWKRVRTQCAGQIGSMLELLQGRLSKGVMGIVTHHSEGLFPQPKEIKFSCDCPDWADMCKHVAAVLYGVGARLDQRPDLLFLLRNVDHEELISAELDMQTATAGKGRRRRLAGQDLSDVFGVEIEDTPAASPGKRAVTGKAARSPVRKPASTKAARVKTPTRKKAAAKAVQKTVVPVESRAAMKTRKKVAAKEKATLKISRKAAVGVKSRAAVTFGSKAARKVARTSVAPAKTRKTVSVKKTAVPKTERVARKKTLLPTARSVARLRKRFDMNKSQFAKLLGVSQQAVAIWENSSGKLNLRQRTREAVTQVRELTLDQAWARLKGD